jgi:cyclase
MKTPFMLLALALAISYAAENYTGNGGKGTSITISVPQANGLAENQKHLPALVQAEFVSNFSGYSAISVLDWERLDDIYNKLFSDHYGDSAQVARQDLGNLAPTTYFMDGKITKTATGYHLQISISKTADKMTAASYSGTFTFWELDNLTGIRRASLDLLQKMGVALTAKAQGELSGEAAANHVNAQTAFARGITAQRQGTEVAALSYYFQAATFDPSMMEAANRSSVLNANISSGNMGNDVRNDIQWRKEWVARLKETEQFFDNFNKTESMPYTLFYSKEIEQGKINYQNETITLSINTYLYGSDIWTLSIERALQALYDGLNATKRKDIWELGSWPHRGVTDLKAFERRSNNFSVVFELVNNQNKVIGRQTLQTRGSWGLNWSNRPRVEVSSGDRKTLSFQNVNANDITDNITIRVASVNGTEAETAAINGVLQIRAITKSEVGMNDGFKFARGEIQGFASYGTKMANLVIPNAIWGDPVISIGSEAFKNSGITSITIPNSVRTIGNNAFMNDSLASITIGANVAMAGAFQTEAYSLDRYNFEDSYSKSGKKAGTYSIRASFLIDSRDGQKYRIVKMDNQMWMAENLNYNANGSKCYGGSESNCKKYGRLYNWNTAKKVCPSGWHLPSKAEWDVLSNSVGGYKTEGKYLKAKNGWNNNGNGQDTHGFSALPGGFGYSDDFSSIGNDGRWWSASESSGGLAYIRLIGYKLEIASWDDFGKDFLHSVRCVQDRKLSEVGAMWRGKLIPNFSTFSTMLTKRLIICLDVRNRKVTKGVKFKDNIDVGDPSEMGAKYSAEGVDELVFYDITASAERRQCDIEMVRDIAKNVFIPFSVGGGVRNLEDMRQVLLAGAEKVSINSLAVLNPSIIEEGAKAFGKQCIVLGMDAMFAGVSEKIPSGYEVVIRGGRERMGIDAVEWAKKAEALGIGEICLNSIDTDGVQNGYELAITEKISSAVSVPVIASGGAGEPKHIAELFEKTGASAALVASMVHFGNYSVGQIKQAMKAAGIAARLI